MIERIASRVLVVDENHRILLLRGFDPKKPEISPWWFTPGGGLDAGESIHECAERELWEETGLQVEINPGPIWERKTQFEFYGNTYLQHEFYFLIHTTCFIPTPVKLSPIEIESISGHKWWSYLEIIQTEERIYPSALLERFDELLQKKWKSTTLLIE